MKCKNVELYVEFYEAICLHILEQIYFITITVSHINIQYERTYMYCTCIVQYFWWTHNKMFKL